MSWAAHHVEYVNDYVLTLALRGDFGPELKRLVEEGEIDAYELFDLLDRDQQIAAMSAAHRDWAENLLAVGDARREELKERQAIRELEE